MKTSELLIKWYHRNGRDLPWRHTNDAYSIWLSEIILQQTRVDQGLPYYQKFISRFPNVKSLAEATENEVLQLWQGLGYYSRARNLHSTAKHIHFNLNGRFPDTYDEILTLKGVGSYTASAIASFAYQLPHPVIDGNVLRVISRLFAIDKPVNQKHGLVEIEQSLDSIFDPSKPADFNQAIMELGSLVCKPTTPNCISCPISTKCLAFGKSNQHAYPIKIKKTNVKVVYHSYFVFRFENKTYIEQRKSGIWSKLHQFPMVEKKLEHHKLKSEISRFTDQKYTTDNAFSFTHLLSHRKILAEFYTIYLDEPLDVFKKPIFEIDIDELGKTYPTSMLTQKYINSKNGK